MLCRVEPRRAGGSDLRGITDLWLALTRHHADREECYALRPEAGGEVRRLLEAQLRDPRTAIFVCAGEAAELDGFVLVRVLDAPPIHFETRRAEISDLFVAPASRRRGVGRGLVEAASRWAHEQGAARVEVQVSVHNPEGQAFWRAVGYADRMDVLERRL